VSFEGKKNAENEREKHLILASISKQAEWIILRLQRSSLPTRTYILLSRVSSIVNAIENSIQTESECCVFEKGGYAIHFLFYFIYFWGGGGKVWMCTIDLGLRCSANE
jgi:hypothetical protein